MAPLWNGVCSISLLSLMLILNLSPLGVQGDAELPSPELYQPLSDGDVPSPPLLPTPGENSTTVIPADLNPDPNDGAFMDASCRHVTSEVVSSFRNPSYPAKEKNPVICHHVIRPMKEYCALRVEFLETTMSPPVQGCSTDTFQILNSLDTPTVIQCGFLAGYQFTIRSSPGRLVTLLATTQSESSWNVKLTQIQCSSVKAAEGLLPKDCGIPGDPAEALRNGGEDVMLIKPTELLRVDNKSALSPLREDETSIPEGMLRRTLLGFNHDLKIVNGNETGVNEFPWQVLLLVNGKPICGGSLISEDMVLTAGHCSSILSAAPILSSLLVVDLGDHDLTSASESPNVVYRVQKIIPNIQHDVVHSDISLLKLKKKVEFSKFISPVCLPRWVKPGTSYDGAPAITTGWGKTSDGGVISPVLRKAEVKIVPLELCRRLWEQVGTGGGEMIEDGMICAGGGDVGPCNGDSGGPLVVRDESSGRFSLIGVTSFGSLKGCAVEGVPTVFTRVTSFLDWILLNLAEV